MSDYDRDYEIPLSQLGEEINETAQRLLTQVVRANVRSARAAKEYRERTGVSFPLPSEHHYAWSLSMDAQRLIEGLQMTFITLGHALADLEKATTPAEETLHLDGCTLPGDHKGHCDV